MLGAVVGDELLERLLRVGLLLRGDESLRAGDLRLAVLRETRVGRGRLLLHGRAEADLADLGDRSELRLHVLPGRGGVELLLHLEERRVALAGRTRLGAAVLRDVGAADLEHLEVRVSDQHEDLLLVEVEPHDRGDDHRAVLVLEVLRSRVRVDEDGRVAGDVGQHLLVLPRARRELRAPLVGRRREEEHRGLAGELHLGAAGVDADDERHVAHVLRPVLGGLVVGERESGQHHRRSQDPDRSHVPALRGTHAAADAAGGRPRTWHTPVPGARPVVCPDDRVHHRRPLAGLDPLRRRAQEPDPEAARFQLSPFPLPRSRSPARESRVGCGSHAKSPHRAAADTARRLPSAPMSIDALLANAVDGGRLTPAEGLRLFEEASLLDLGAAAHAVRMRLHPDPVVSYIIDRNVNYSNICDSYCRFCSFFAAPGSKDGYLLSKATLTRKIEETKRLGGNQVLMQGGTHPEWDVAWYADLIGFVKSHGIHVHALSAPEITKIAQVSKLSVRRTIERLRDAGLDSIPGGGAEILTDHARNLISPMKCTTEQWLEVHREAHAIG